MNSRSRYKTKQREILIEYFEGRPGKHITAGDVSEYCKEQGALVGQSTIYRQLESLVDEGIINKYTIDVNSPACFEYIGEEVHEDKETCFHCKCEKCGKLIHLHCEELEEIRDPKIRVLVDRALLKIEESAEEKLFQKDLFQGTKLFLATNFPRWQNAAEQMPQETDDRGVFAIWGN